MRNTAKRAFQEMQMDCDEVFPFSANFTSWPLLGSSGYKVKSLQSMWIDRIGQRGGGGGPALGMAESWLWDVWGGRVGDFPFGVVF